MTEANREHKDILFRDVYNDLAFVIEGRVVVLIEHQSTINKNMPLKILVYLADVYRAIMPEDTLHSEVLKPIPAPEFFVIYNGPDKHPDMVELKLSDAFMGHPVNPGIELVVPVYSIAKGHNKALLAHTKALNDYSLLISLIYDELDKGTALADAIEKVIKYCIKNDIMAEYLKNNPEVRKMLNTQWNEEVFVAAKIADGKLRAKIEMAQTMKAKGYPSAEIAELTGLTIEQIEALEPPDEPLEDQAAVQ